MEPKASAERLQGMLIAQTVLLEALLQQLPSVVLREMFATYQRNWTETENTLLNTLVSEGGLEGYRAHSEAMQERLRSIWQQAILRDARHPKG